LPPEIEINEYSSSKKITRVALVGFYQIVGVIIRPGRRRSSVTIRYFPSVWTEIYTGTSVDYKPVTAK